MSTDLNKMIKHDKPHTQPRLALTLILRRRWKVPDIERLYVLNTIIVTAIQMNLSVLPAIVNWRHPHNFWKNPVKGSKAFKPNRESDINYFIIGFPQSF